MAISTALYVLGQLLLATGLAALAARNTTPLPISTLGRVAFGVATTPFVSGSLVAAIIFIWPGQPVVLLSLAPVLTGIMILVFTYPSQNTLSSTISTLPWKTLLFWTITACVAILSFTVLVRLFHYGSHPTDNSDALQYLAQAQHLLSHRSLFSYAGIDGLPDGTLRGDAHGILWVAYLASSLAVTQGMESADAEIVARSAFQLTLLSYFSAGIACASVFRFRFAIILALLFLLVVPGLSSASITGDRDAFRLAGLLLLMTFLLAHAQERLHFAYHPGTLLLAAILGFWSLQGHGLSLALVPVLTVTWFFCVLILRLGVLRGFAISFAIAAGFAVAALPVASAYMRTGSPLGDNVAAARMLEDTPYGQGAARRDQERIGTGADRLARIGITIGRDSGWPSLLAVATVLFLFVGSLKNYRSFLRPPRKAAVHLILSVWFLSFSVLLLDIVPLGYFEIGAWTVLNPRYAMQWYVVAGLLGGWAIAAALVYLDGAFLKRLNLSSLVSASILAIMTWMTVKNIEINWPIYESGLYISFSEELNGLAEQLPENCRILSEDTGISFHASRTVVQMYSKSQLPLMQLNDSSEIVEWLDEHDLCAVLVVNGLYVDTAGTETPLARALASNAFRLYDAAPWRIYFRTPTAP